MRNSAVVRTVACLEFQSDFHCSQCGACCCSDWVVSISQNLFDRIARALREGRLVAPGVTPENAMTRNENAPEHRNLFHAHLAFGPQGCPFLEREGERTACAIQRQLGSEALPLICQVYPRICILQPNRVSLTLSNYCPTARQALWREDLEGAGVAIVKNPPAFPVTAVYAGHDTVEQKPPLLRPQMPLTWEAYERWEQFCVERMADERLTPENALIHILTAAEKIRGWAGTGPIPVGPIESLAQSEAAVDPEALSQQIAQLPSGLPLCRNLYELLFQPLSGDKSSRLTELFQTFQDIYGPSFDPQSPAFLRLTGDYDQFVRPFWPQWERPLRRYLASKLFANYYAYEGHGLRTGLYGVVLILATLRIHAILLAQAARRPLDKPLLDEAFALTDRYWLSIAERETLAHGLTQIETASLMELLGPVHI
ncbi:MAG TPA: hypothetical protein PLA90_14280 [Candidatus Sumerlaeota bacterium]|nr:hypothetical protein [Candidatus Sumerlaeota bacterium]HPS02701.1 hypothetical protein [Candidatus Sumerlaeota bacterium]